MVLGYVVMPEHVHFLVSEPQQETFGDTVHRRTRTRREISFGLTTHEENGQRVWPRNYRQAKGTVVTKDEAWSLANHWIAAWNAHDLDLIMTHYDDAIELISPVAAHLLGTPDGKVAGKPNLGAYFQRGLEAYPELHFLLEDVLLGVNSIVLCYTNQKGTRTAEFMELSASGKVARVVANYSS